MCLMYVQWTFSHARQWIYHTACRFWSLQCTLLPCGSVLVPGAMSLSCSLEPLRVCEQGTAACPGTVLGWQEPLHLSRHWNLHHLAIPLETWIVLTSYAVSWPPAWKSCTEPCAVWFPVVPSLPLMQPCSRTASLEAGKELPHQVTKGHSLFSTFPLSLRKRTLMLRHFFPALLVRWTILDLCSLLTGPDCQSHSFIPYLCVCFPSSSRIRRSPFPGLWRGIPETHCLPGGAVQAAGHAQSPVLSALKSILFPCVSELTEINVF